MDLGIGTGNLIPSSYCQCALEHSATAHDAFFSIFNAAYHHLSFSKSKING